MSTITTINAGDNITDSRAVINTNFSNLNTDKVETSAIDTDTSLAANSDAKIPSQKAVKAYVDAGGNVNASETTKGIVEEATDAEVTSGSATGGTSAKLFVTPAKLLTYLAANYLKSSMKAGVTTRDISTASGNQTIAHGLGRTPVQVNVTVYNLISSGGTVANSQGVWNSAGNFALYTSYKFTSTEAALTGSTSSFSIYILDDTTGTNYATGTITVDSTNITIAWVKNGTPSGTVDIMWEAM